MITDNTDQIVRSLMIGLKSPELTRAFVEFSQKVTQQKQSQLLDQAWNDRELVRLVKFQSGADTDLATARDVADAYKVPFKFKSIRVQAASGADVQVYLIAGKNVSGRDAILLRQNDTINFDYLTEGWLYWEAQSGETMDIIFGVDVTFRQGSLISESTGRIVIGEGANISTPDNVTVDDTAGGIEILPTLATRTKAIIQNQGSNQVRLGASTGLTFAKGIILEPDGVFEYRGTAALYGICNTGLSSSIGILELEE